MGDKTRWSLVEGKNDETGTDGNSETDFGSLRFMMGVYHPIYISDTEMEEKHWYHSINYTIYIQIYLLIPIDLLNLKVKLLVYSSVLSISSVLKSLRILLPWNPEY